jgi:hypothetical protein
MTLVFEMRNQGFFIAQRQEKDLTFRWLYSEIDISRRLTSLSRFYQELTIDVIARIAMGQKESTLFSSPYLETVKRIFNRSASNIFGVISTSMPFLAPVISVLAKSMSLSVFKDTNGLMRTIYQAVEERRQQRVRPFVNSTAKLKFAAQPNRMNPL